ISFTLEGKKLHGKFALVRMKGRKGKPLWLLIKKDDEFAEPGWQPDLIEPDERFKPDGQESKPAKSPRKSKPAATGKSKKTRRSKTIETESSETISVAAFLKRERLEGNVNLKIGKHVVELTHLDKFYWPKEKITKGDLIRYYLEVGETIVPYLKGRPAILKRYPNGIEEEGFFQHNVISAPAYLKTK